MKIIKRGNPPEMQVINATCRQCKTEIEFTRGEARLVPDDRDGDYLAVDCPICGNVITVGHDAQN